MNQPAKSPDPFGIKARIKQDWSAAPYYEAAEREGWMAPFWAKGSPFRALFERLDTAKLVELACGRGRHSALVLNTYRVSSLVLVDINETNIAWCRERFAERTGVTFYVTGGSDIACCEDGSVSAVFCYDAMVHFEYDDVAAYCREIYRALKPGGKALLHHSNNCEEPGKLYSDCRLWRNFMSIQLFNHMMSRVGMQVVEQQTIDWGGVKDIDALTLLQRP